MRVHQYGGGDWSQLGPDIDGEAAADHIGYSVSLRNDGDMVAIGAPDNDVWGVSSVHVQMYE